MYVAPGIDITFNLSNAIYGYNPNRIFNLSAFIGGGANIGWGYEAMIRKATGRMLLLLLSMLLLVTTLLSMLGLEQRFVAMAVQVLLPTSVLARL